MKQREKKKTRGHWPIAIEEQKTEITGFGVQNDPKIYSMRPQFSTPPELGTACLKTTFIQILYSNFQTKLQICAYLGSEMTPKRGL